MIRGSNENLGFQSRMSVLELKLKKSEDERLALEEKFNKLLSARKSEEAMELYLLRENYSQLLRQDKMRCDRNDSLLQTLASVESRASMLTAKTDRLRLLRQHYESYMSHHYPEWKRAVNRHRSVESFVSESNLHETPSQRSFSPSPRLISSCSSTFTRSPSLTRRNSLVVPTSEISESISGKVPNKINMTPNSFRRRLFEDSPKRETTLDNRLSSLDLYSVRDDTKPNSFTHQTPNILESNHDNSTVGEHFEDKSTNSGIHFQIPSYRCNINTNLSNNAGEDFKRDSSITKVDESVMSTSPKRLNKLNLHRNITDTLLSNPFMGKPLTKSSSFNVGSPNSKYISNYISPERRSSIIRRPSFVYRTTVSSQPPRIFKTSAMSSLSTSPFERCRSSFSIKSPISQRSNSPMSERDKSPLGERGRSSSFINTKSPLTVVDDIFKKYLINYDKRYLSDPISESKYGKYLYPLSHYDSDYREHVKANKFLYPLDSKFGTRSTYYDDNTSVSSRESVVPMLYKTSGSYGSSDSLFSNEHQHSVFERNLPHFSDRKDWKEWDYYRNRYEFPPAAAFERSQTKSPYVGDVYYPITRQNITAEIGKTTSYEFAGDVPESFSNSLNLHGGSNQYISPKICFEKFEGTQNRNYSKDNLLSHERNISAKEDLTLKEASKIPLTPKKVSFSNEFLYDDKSDTEISSHVDGITVPLDDVKNTKPTTESIKTISPEKHCLQFLSQDINCSTGAEPLYKLQNNEGKLEIGETEIDSLYESAKVKTALATKDVVTEDSLVTKTKDLENSKNKTIDESEKNCEGNSQNYKAFLSTDNEDEAKQVTESSYDSNQYPATKDNGIELVGTFSNDNLLIDNGKGEDLSERKEEREAVDQMEGINTEVIKEKQGYHDNDEINTTEPKTVSSVTSKTKDFPTSLQDSSSISNTSEERSTIGSNDEMLTAEKIIHPERGITYTRKETSKGNAFIEHDLNQVKNNSSENLPRQELADSVTYDAMHKGNEDGFNSEQHVVYNSDPQEPIRTYNDSTGQQYENQNIYTNPEISIPEYEADYSREQYEPTQFDQYSKEYVQQNVSSYDQTQNVYDSEEYREKDYQQPEDYTGNDYEQQHIDYNAAGFNQHNVQDYQQSSVPQQQYQDESYIPQYKEGDQGQYPIEHYPSDNVRQSYVTEQTYEGEYPPEYAEQKYDDNFPETSQDPQQQPEQYKAEYDPAYQENPSYSYDQVEGTYKEQYEQQQYDQKQPYEQYEQQPEQYEDHYQATSDQYGNYDYAYDQQEPAAEHTYMGDDQQGYVEKPESYKYNEAQPYDDTVQKQPYDSVVQQQPYDDVVQQQPYNDVVQQPYDDQQQPYDNVVQQPYDVQQQPYDNFQHQPYDDIAQKPYDVQQQPYNDVAQQPYDDVTQQQPYMENMPYEEVQQPYTVDQNIYSDQNSSDEQQAYDTSCYAPQNLNTTHNKNMTSNYDYSLQTDTSQPGDSQLLTQQGQMQYETDGQLLNNTQYATREDVNEPAPKLNQILDSDPESMAQGPVTNEDSSDFDFSANQK